MRKINPTVEEVEEILDLCFQRSTSADPEGWNTDNPTWGHCAVVALLVQDIFGGDILRMSLEDTPFEDMRSHYWNRLPDGREVDFTRSQFGHWEPPYGRGEVQPRSRPFGYLGPARRYCKFLDTFLQVFAEAA